MGRGGEDGGVVLEGEVEGLLELDAELGVYVVDVDGGWFGGMLVVVVLSVEGVAAAYETW